MSLEISSKQDSIHQSLTHNRMDQAGLSSALEKRQIEERKLLGIERALRSLQSNYDRFVNNSNLHKDPLLQRTFQLAVKHLEILVQMDNEEIVKFTDNGTNDQVIDTSQTVPSQSGYVRMAFQTHRDTLIPSIVVLQPTEDPDVFQTQELQLTEWRGYTGSRNYFFTGECRDEHMILRGNHELTYPDFRTSFGVDENTSLVDEIPEEYDLFAQAVSALEGHYSQKQD